MAKMLIDEIKGLSDGDSYIVPESDYGKAEIWYKHGVYFVFEIPPYGGRPEFLKSIYYPDNVVRFVESLT